MNVKKDDYTDNAGIMLDQKKIDSRIFYRTIKKLTDKLLSALALIILSPVLLIVSVLIKREDDGPVFYVQQRIGRNGKILKMYKFRSMVVDADKKIDKLESKNEIDGAMFKIRNDPRVTHIGQIIRKYSLDELPQLINVLRGDMALVGPRPPLEREVKNYTKYDLQRLMVTPGCTGLWQVTKRNSVGFHEMVQLDIKYIQKSSLLFDLEILFKTVKIMIKPNDAY
ncbi:sugar transferase [Secundilactobacillus pentosiphilus]|nr:sugar transferase [Secundilactobacillus pentosiphilus]